LGSIEGVCQAAIRRGLKQLCIDLWKCQLGSKDHAKDAVDRELRLLLGMSIAGDKEEKDEDE